MKEDEVQSRFIVNKQGNRYIFQVLLTPIITEDNVVTSKLKLVP